MLRFPGSLCRVLLSSSGEMLMPLFVFLSGISAWLSTTSSVSPSVTSGSNLSSAFQALLCCLKPLPRVGPSAELGTWARLYTETGSVCHISPPLGLPTLSGLQRSLSLSLARSWVAFPAVWVHCAVAAPRWGHIFGQSLEGKEWKKTAMSCLSSWL